MPDEPPPHASDFETNPKKQHGIGLCSDSRQNTSSGYSTGCLKTRFERLSVGPSCDAILCARVVGWVVVGCRSGGRVVGWPGGSSVVGGGCGSSRARVFGRSGVSGGEGAGGVGKRGQGWLGVGCGWLKLRQRGKRMGVMWVVPGCVSVCVVCGVGHDTFSHLVATTGTNSRSLVMW